MNQRLHSSFFERDVIEIAPMMIGKLLFRDFGNGVIKHYVITEVEAYRGEEDLACHASKGRTRRTEVMYHNGGKLYVYLIYGMYWMLNIVTSEHNFPAAILIRGIEGFTGPGKVGRELQIDASFYGEELDSSNRIWIEDSEIVPPHSTSPRIGIDYSGPIWSNKEWRYFALK